MLERFQAKWMTVRVKKTREYKNLDHFHVSTKHENGLDFSYATIRKRLSENSAQVEGFAA